MKKIISPALNNSPQKSADSNECNNEAPPPEQQEHLQIGILIQGYKIDFLQLLKYTLSFM